MHCVYNSPYGQPKVHATHPAGTNLVSTEKFLRADVADVLNVISVNPVWELTSLQCCGFRKEAAASSCLRISWLPQLSPTPAEKKISSPACCKVLQLRWHLRERRGGLRYTVLFLFPELKRWSTHPKTMWAPPEPNGTKLWVGCLNILDHTYQALGHQVVTHTCDLCDAMFLVIILLV